MERGREHAPPCEIFFPTLSGRGEGSVPPRGDEKKFFVEGYQQNSPGGPKWLGKGNFSLRTKSAEYSANKSALPISKRQNLIFALHESPLPQLPFATAHIALFKLVGVVQLATRGFWGPSVFVHTQGPLELPQPYKTSIYHHQPPHLQPDSV